MPVKWKNASRFKPEQVLARINSARKIMDDGSTSYDGFEIREKLPVLQSMLEVPPAAEHIDLSTLIWSALGRVREKLTGENVLRALNDELRQRLSAREDRFAIVTSLSLNFTGLPQSYRFDDVKIQCINNHNGVYFKSHQATFSQRKSRIDSTPHAYQWLVVHMKAKSPDAAFGKAMRVVDLHRAVWCLMGNPTMEINFGSARAKPINVIRPGGFHTLHKIGGAVAQDDYWYESNFSPVKCYRFSNPSLIAKNTRLALRKIESCIYGKNIVVALIRFVRALDQADPDVAFIRLWGALETLVTPERADYDVLVRRCAFLFKDGAYHRQVLEHLREYRNQHVHGGFESVYARIHCFQLQMYFVEVVWFFLAHASRFSTLREISDFLDMPADINALRKNLALTRQALHFIAPRRS